jgi:hypothetical protein
MARMVLVDIMDAIAEQCDLVFNGDSDGIVIRVYNYPDQNVQVPCIVVGYPSNIDFDLSFRDGSDRLKVPVWVMVGKAHDRSARERLSVLLTGVKSIKAGLDGDLGGAVQSCRVEDCTVEPVTVNNVEYLSAQFVLDILS